MRHLVERAPQADARLDGGDGGVEGGHGGDLRYLILRGTSSGSHSAAGFDLRRKASRTASTTGARKPLLIVKSFAKALWLQVSTGVRDTEYGAVDREQRH